MSCLSYTVVSLAHCWGICCTVDILLWMHHTLRHRCVSGKISIRIWSHHWVRAGVNALPMSFKTCERIYSIRSSYGTQLFAGEYFFVFMLIFDIILSQCHMLTQWRRNVLILPAMGATFSTLSFNMKRMRDSHERFRWGMISIWFSCHMRVKNDISKLWESNNCYDAQKKLHKKICRFPFVCRTKRRGKWMVIFLRRNSTITI